MIMIHFAKGKKKYKMKMGISKEIMLGYVNYKSWAVCFFILYFKNFESKNKNETKDV